VAQLLDLVVAELAFALEQCVVLGRWRREGWFGL